jgi:NADH:ubiquinone oxidoreductase subunit E
VECIAACEGAPAVLINEELHRCVTREKLDRLLDRSA